MDGFTDCLATSFCWPQPPLPTICVLRPPGFGWRPETPVSAGICPATQSGRFRASKDGITYLTRYPNVLYRVTHYYNLLCR